jgi:hypothetical protein
MQTAKRDVFENRSSHITTTHTVAGSPRREETEVVHTDDFRAAP